MQLTGLQNLLELAIQNKASDIHLVASKSPVFRIHGELSSWQALDPLSPEDIKSLISTMVTEQQKDIYLRERELDFSFATSVFGFNQFRVNLYFEKGNMAVTIRILNSQISESIIASLPPIVKKLANKRKGLVIVSGTAGSGKTTTLTYLIDHINRERKCKIITIEDPIEFIHQSKQSLVVQREVGADTFTFAKALKYSLRQDPDVVVIGEIRDYESISMALTTAETGHLVFTTVHAADVVETLNRIIDVYPMGSRDQLCMQMAGNLIAIISQTLIPQQDGQGRILCTEAMMASIPIRNLIRRGAFNELRGQMDQEEEEDSHTLETSLIRLVKKGIISLETAKNYTKHEELLMMTERRDFRTAGQTLSEDVEKKHSWLTAKPKEEREVLIIDINPRDILSMTTAFQDEGYKKVSAVETGEEAFAIITSKKIDIVVLDTARSGRTKLDCFEVCRWIKAFKGNAIEVIVITGSLKVDTIDEARKAGADDFVIKTSTFDLLRKIIKKLENK